jgi:tRNA-uridine 2-sulfurtransferase
MSNQQAHVIVGMSGGVDSAVAALLLKNQDYKIQGVFMQNWEADRDDPYCSIPQDLADAEKVCNQLQIPLTVVNFSKEYWERVFQNFLDEYAAGRTPNPDILCNKEIKFKAFLQYALDQGADYIATGHYARTVQINGSYQLLKGIDQNKDQSYFLYTLGQAQLSHSLFPLGELNKNTVRNLAEKAGLINFAKKDSTGICFIGERNFKKFLSEYLLAKPGDIITTEQQVIGKHDGLMFYTLGQRKGLSIGGRKDAQEKPWYVAAKDLNKNQLIVTQEHNHSLLLSSSLVCSNIHWIKETAPNLPIKCCAKTRYRQSDQTCVITKLNTEQFQVNFAQPQWAVTPGQSVVFYQNDECLGGGIIN